MSKCNRENERETVEHLSMKNENKIVFINSIQTSLFYISFSKQTDKYWKLKKKLQIEIFLCLRKCTVLCKCRWSLNVTHEYNEAYGASQVHNKNFREAPA